MRNPFAGMAQSIWARLTSEPRSPEARRIGYSGRTIAGVAVNADTALQTATVWACHRYLTQTVAQLPARVRRQRADGFSEAVAVHPVDSVLTFRANPELSPFQLVETLMGWAIMRGNGVAEIETDAVGRLVALWPIHPDRVHILRDVNTEELVYRVSNGGVKPPTDLAPAQVFHLRGFGHGPVGLSVIEYAAQSIGWARATELFGASYFGQGMQFSGVVEIPNKGVKESLSRMRTELEQKHQGPTRAHKWAFLDNGAKINKISATPNEGQFIETAQYQVEELCRWYGVPPQKVGHLLRMTFNNVEQLSIEVVVDSITPWVIRFEQEANFKLFGQNRQNLFLKLDLKGLLRGDFLSRQQGLEIMRRNGVVCADDWAELEDMKKVGPVNGGDKYIVNSANTTLKAIGETPPPAPQLPPPAKEPPPPAEEPPDPKTQATVIRIADYVRRTRLALRRVA